MRVRLFLIPVWVIVFLLFCSCQRSREGVVIYVSVDQNYAEPVIKRFEKVSGIKVLPVYDLEASKTTGLVNRIIAEKDHPLADVFWSGEFVQTIALKEQGLLSPYQSLQAINIPDKFKDTEGYWTGFSGRARVFLVNTDKLHPDQYPNSILDLIEPKIPANEIGLALPLFGTTYTQASSLYAFWGAHKAYDFFKQIEESAIQILNGNSSVRDFVADGKLSFGLTDTDDACSALQRGKPVAIIFPDQESFGTLVVPNTVALIHGGSHPELGKKFIDYLLSPETLDYFIKIGWCHVPLRNTHAKPACLDGSKIQSMDLSLYDIYQGYLCFRDSLKQLYLR